MLDDLDITSENQQAQRNHRAANSVSRPVRMSTSNALQKRLNDQPLFPLPTYERSAHAIRLDEIEIELLALGWTQEKIDDSLAVPDHMQCGLSHEIMFEPSLVKDSECPHAYERNYLMKWLYRDPSHPETRVPVKNIYDDVLEARALKKEIDDLMKSFEELLVNAKEPEGKKNLATKSLN